MACATGAGELLLMAVSAVPAYHYLIALVLLGVVWLYNFLEFHSVGDLIGGWRGGRVALTFDPTSQIYSGVVSKCRILRRRYLTTPWLASPHVQTAFLTFFGRPPAFTYRRQLFSVHDGGTIALDWLLASDVLGAPSDHAMPISKDDATPIVVVVPGLTSDSACAYIKHLVYRITKQGWHAVVSNHRGLGGVSITSDCFYNAGWTEDTREVVNYLHHEHPRALLFAVGTSIGANILVKYLGEDGPSTPVAGAASICSPWDLLIGDRFIKRKLIQRLYDKALTIGLKGYAQQHQPVYTRLANWEGIWKSRSIRDFDSHATCLVGKFETVDTYYRRCSSVSFVGNVSVPLLCISALDDPVCTKEAIPWDECRTNKNIVLVTTDHGGHLAFFEGFGAKSIWWTRAVTEFLGVLHSSSFMHRPEKIQSAEIHSSLDSSIDKSPYINLMEDGTVAAMREDGITNAGTNDQTHTETNLLTPHEPAQSSEQKAENYSYIKIIQDITAPMKRSISQLSRRSHRSMWLLVYVAIVTTWPVVGSALLMIHKRRLRNAMPAPWRKQ